MSVIKRVGRLLRADIHGILDCLEEPEAIARQAVREMREEIERCEQELKTAQAEIKRNEQGIAQAAAEISNFDEQLELCFGAGDDKLAKSIIRKRLEYQRTAKTLSENKVRMEQDIASRQKQIEDYRQRLQSVEQKLELLVKQEAARSEVFDNPAFADSIASVSDEEVEIAFLKERKKYCADDSAREEAAS
ncbi:MAG: PspA/IM30 family protein [Bdellovibrionales bacterium]|nr:PspA/IM30 family protein [Bdellovibrionales bacterium]